MAGTRPHSTSPHWGAARWFMAFLLVLIALTAVTAVVVAATSGQTPLAVAIGLISLAFFSRVGC